MSEPFRKGGPTDHLLQSVAGALDAVFNGGDRGADRRNGFVLMVFPFDAPEGARVNYVGNADRESVRAALKEVVARFEGRAHGSPEGAP